MTFVTNIDFKAGRDVSLLQSIMTLKKSWNRHSLESSHLAQFTFWNYPCTLWFSRVFGHHLCYIEEHFGTYRWYLEIGTYLFEAITILEALFTRLRHCNVKINLSKRRLWCHLLTYWAINFLLKDSNPSRSTSILWIDFRFQRTLVK